jgi:hypothetical protein
MASNTQITTATNITGPDISLATDKLDARKYFNNFYATPFSVSSDTDAAILGFFEEYTSNKIAAKNLAAAVLYTAMAQNINPLAVLSEFQNLPKGQLNNYLIAFLNINRAPTSTLGVRGNTKTSPYVSRTILL